MPRMPDFIVVGFPKCATHVLIRTLGEHPDLCTHPHEGKYFGRDRITQEEYQDLFDGPGRVCGEKTAAYILDPKAMREIRDTLPNVKLIVCLRHPIHMLHSFYNFRVWEYENGWPTGFDGKEHPFHDIVLSGDDVHRFSRDAADYGRHLGEHVWPHVPARRVHYVFQEQLWADPQAVATGITNFLGVPPNPLTWRVINSKSPGSPRYPFVDYAHPKYREALALLIESYGKRQAALFDQLGAKPLEWIEYDAYYAALRDDPGMSTTLREALVIPAQ